jgi:osmotically-inducible protein OsmY
MKNYKLLLIVLSFLSLGMIAGCWANAHKSPDVQDTLRKSLDQAGYKDVTVAQDLDKGIVTLGGQVSTQSDKAQAENLAKSLAGGQVVADQIAVVPPGTGYTVNAVNSDLDQGIEKNLDAALIQSRMHEDVHYAVKNGVVTLTGDVNSNHARRQSEAIASAVPYVHQVVNALEVVKNRKASSSQ